MAHAHDHRNLIDSVNESLDRLPRAEIRIGDRQVPTFLVSAIAGLTFGSLLLLTSTALSDGDVLVAFGLVPIATCASIVLAVLRMRRAGIEQWVLLEHLAVGLAAISGTLALVGEPLLPWLDRVLAGYSVIFFFGRLGCAAAGCCYGHASSIGIDRGPGHVAPGRRFPVQLLEAVCWAACAALGVSLSAAARPGLAFGTTALLYSVVRFFIESLRADERPQFVGLTESRWLSLLFGSGAVFVLHRAGCLSPAGASIGAAGLVAAIALGLTGRAWIWLKPATDPLVLQELATFGRALAARGPDGGVHRTELAAVVLVASWLNTGKGFELYISISAANGDVLGYVEAELMLESIAQGLGIRGETPSVVEVGPGHYATRFARDEVHVVDTSRYRARTEDADQRRRYFNAHADIAGVGGGPAE